jgi:hypothetical protein
LPSTTVIAHTVKLPTVSHTLQPARPPLHRSQDTIDGHSDTDSSSSDTGTAVTADTPQGPVTEGAPARAPLAPPLPVDDGTAERPITDAQPPCCTPPSLHELACGSRWQTVRRVVIGGLVFCALIGGGCALALDPGLRRRTFVAEVVGWATKCLGSGAAGEAETMANDYFDRLDQAHLIPVDLGDCPPAGTDIAAVLIDRFDEALADAPLTAAASAGVPPLLLAFALWLLLRRVGLLD